MGKTAIETILEQMLLTEKYPDASHIQVAHMRDVCDRPCMIVTVSYRDVYNLDESSVPVSYESVDSIRSAIESLNMREITTTSKKDITNDE